MIELFFFLGLIFRVFVIEMIFLRAWESLRCSVYLSGVVIFRLAEVPGDRARPLNFNDFSFFSILYKKEVSMKLVHLSCSKRRVLRQQTAKYYENTFLHFFRPRKMINRSKVHNVWDPIDYCLIVFLFFSGIYAEKSQLCQVCGRNAKRKWSF